MNAPPILLADVETEEILSFWRLADPASREGIIIFGAIGLVTLLVLLWAVFFRKTRRRRPSHHHAHRHASPPAEPSEAPAEDRGGPPPERRRQRRRLRRRRRSRNPTLAETGGLPPIRPEGPAEL